MDNPDARTLTPEAQEELRRQAIRMLVEGETQQQVADQCEVSRKAIGNWWAAYRKGGWNALNKQRRRRKQGERSRLSPEQELQVQKVLCDKTPDQLKMRFALWSREAVRKLIEERFGRQHVGRLLNRWGFTPQRPINKAYENRPAEVKCWMEETYPKVQAKAKEENAEIWWGDETAVKPECHYRRGSSPKGKTPIVRQPAKRFHSSLISALNNQGKMQWMPLKEPLHAQSFITFLEQLVKHRKRKVILILDNLRVDQSKLVKAWVAENRQSIELVYFPAYSPELDSHESFNDHLK